MISVNETKTITIVCVFFCFILQWSIFFICHLFEMISMPVFVYHPRHRRRRRRPFNYHNTKNLNIATYCLCFNMCVCVGVSGVDRGVYWIGRRRLVGSRCRRQTALPAVTCLVVLPPGSRSFIEPMFNRQMATLHDAGNHRKMHVIDRFSLLPIFSPPPFPCVNFKTILECTHPSPRFIRILFFGSFSAKSSDVVE